MAVRGMGGQDDASIGQGLLGEKTSDRQAGNFIKQNGWLSIFCKIADFPLNQADAITQISWFLVKS